MLIITGFPAPLPHMRDPGVHVHTDVSACTLCFVLQRVQAGGEMAVLTCNRVLAFHAAGVTKQCPGQDTEHPPSRTQWEAKRISSLVSSI